MNCFNVSVDCQLRLSFVALDLSSHVSLAVLKSFFLGVFLTQTVNAVKSNVVNCELGAIELFEHEVLNGLFRPV